MCVCVCLKGSSLPKSTATKNDYSRIMGEKDWEMKICCIGAGYNGGTSMAVMAHQCPKVSEYFLKTRCLKRISIFLSPTYHVFFIFYRLFLILLFFLLQIRITVIDNSAGKIKDWNSDTLPIYEPGLKEIVQACRGNNLEFVTTANSNQALQDADVIFISVNAPAKVNGTGNGRSQDIINCENCARLIVKTCRTSKIVVEKGTYPVRTAEAVQRILDTSTTAQHTVLSNPDFVSQGTAIQDHQNPSRVLIGGLDMAAMDVLKNIYQHWVSPDKIITTNTWSAELSKLVANAFLAQRVSSINSIAALCEATGADVTEISQAVGMDQRIGSQFLKASVGFGKSRFRKDLLCLIYLFESYGLKECADYWKNVICINEYQKKRFSQKVYSKMFSNVHFKKIAMLGYAFKKDTSDVRETPPMYVLHDLAIHEMAIVHIYDPEVKHDDLLNELNISCGADHENTPQLDDHVITSPDPYQACEGAHAILLMTDWEEFKTLEYSKIYECMAKPAFFFDGRNFLDHEKLRQIGFEVHGIGRPDPTVHSI